MPSPTAPLKADDKLPTEAELARQFDVSRPTIREALKRLAAKSLIRSRRGPAGGTFVQVPSAEDMSRDLMSSVALMVSLGVFDLTEIAEARHELELVCIRLAVKRRSGAELDRMAAEIELQKDEAQIRRGVLRIGCPLSSRPRRRDTQPGHAIPDVYGDRGVCSLSRTW